MTRRSEAADSFLGYLYQLRFALLCALRSMSPNAYIAVEFLDDVQLADETNSKSSEYILGLHQLKHSVRRRASLGPKSPDLWKTLGNWSELIATKAVNPDECRFCLHTTASISNTSPLRFLRFDEHRKPEAARRELLDAATDSANAIVTENAARLKSIGVTRQKQLFSRMYCADNETDVSTLRDELEAELSVACHPAHLASHLRQLEGWLFDAAIRSMLPGGTRIIPVSLIKAESARIRDGFVADALPDEFSESPVPLDQVAHGDQRTFIKQLLLVKAARARILAAQQDHYRAFAQRSQWSREGLLAIDELPRFDRSLVDEWYRRHCDVCERCDGQDDGQQCDAGLSLFRWVEFESPNVPRLQLRSAANLAFLIRGSFHVLADKCRVGWHPRFRELLTDT